MLPHSDTMPRRALSDLATIEVTRQVDPGRVCRVLWLSGHTKNLSLLDPTLPQWDDVLSHAPHSATKIMFSQQFVVSRDGPAPQSTKGQLSREPRDVCGLNFCQTAGAIMKRKEAYVEKEYFPFFFFFRYFLNLSRL